MYQRTQITPATDEAKRNFLLARADNAEQTAKIWGEQGDEIQAARWMAEANRMREEAR